MGVGRVRAEVRRLRGWCAEQLTQPPLAATVPVDQDRELVQLAKPMWNKTQRQLRLGAKVIRDYSKRRAKNQEQLLDKFQEKQWETTIEAPFDGRQLKDAIDAFNGSVTPDTIRFRGDGTGKGVSWSLAPASGVNHT